MKQQVSLFGFDAPTHEAPSPAHAPTAAPAAAQNTAPATPESGVPSACAPKACTPEACAPEADMTTTHAATDSQPPHDDAAPAPAPPMPAQPAADQPHNQSHGQPHDQPHDLAESARAVETTHDALSPLEADPDSTAAAEPTPGASDGAIAPSDIAGQPLQAAPAAEAEAACAPTAPEASASPRATEQDDWPPMAEMLQSFFVFEPTTAAPEPITVLGLDCARPRGLAGLSETQKRIADAADVICGGRTLLEEFSGQRLENEHNEEHNVEPPQDRPGTPELKARLLPLTTPLEPLLTRLSQLRAAGEKVLVLADGDPLLFGIGATLVRRLGAEAVRLLPAVSSLQQACARLSLPWHKVICLSLHGRDDLRPLNVACGKNAPLCILTDARMSPDVLARHLLDRGVDWFDTHIFERMGAPDESVNHLSLAQAAGREFGPACTMVLVPVAPPRRPCLGFDADQLAVDRGLITKKPVRAAALSLLRIEAGHVVWDIGSGSGAVALEASVLAHEGRVVAVERSAGRAMGIQENRRRFGAANVEVRLGQAPECLPSLPDPHRVFVGGGLSGDDGEDILGHVCLRLPVGGRVVVSCVLLDSFALCRRYFEALNWPVEILQISAAEGKSLGGDIHLAAMNPVFLLAAQKPAPAPIQASAQPEGR